MTVYVTGDIHGGLDMQKLRDWELGDSLGSDDYLIIAGDFSFPWDFSAEECADIAWMESRPYTVLFVDGNHERFDHWAERPMEPWHGGLTQRLSDTSSIRRLMRGEVFELDGKTVFTMGGATSVDRAYRIPYSSWWPQELPDERDFDDARARLDEVAWKVDCVITHTCSTRMLSPPHSGLLGKSRNDRRTYFLTPTNPRSRRMRYSVDLETPVAAQISGIGVSPPR